MTKNRKDVNTELTDEWQHHAFSFKMDFGRLTRWGRFLNFTRGRKKKEGVQNCTLSFHIRSETAKNFTVDLSHVALTED